MSIRVHEGAVEAEGTVDLVSLDDLRLLAEHTGPCLSVLLTTSRFGAGTRSGPSRLHHLIGSAADELAAFGLDESSREQVLAPLRTLQDDVEFWQAQSDGLALYSAPGFFAGYRLPGTLEDRVVVGDCFRVLPLVPHLAAEGAFFLLALAQNSLRLFRGTAASMEELDLGAVPATMRDAIPEAEKERHPDLHSTGGTSAAFHGQGAESDFEKAALERWFRAVDEPLVHRLGTSGVPLVLACVSYYLPIYRAVSRYPLVWDAAVEGNPEHRSAQELHQAAWALVSGHFAEHAARELDRYRQVDGTGRTASGAGEALVAAREGRVDTLFLDLGAARGLTGEVVDRVVLETVTHDGQVRSVAEGEGLGAPVAALLRF